MKEKIVNLLSFMKQDASFETARRAFTEKGSNCIYGLSGTQKAFWLTGLEVLENRPLVIVTHDKERKAQWERDLAFLQPERKQYSFPLLDHLDYAVSAKTLEAESKLMLALSQLVREEPICIVATVEEAAQKIVAKEDILDSLLTWHVGDEVDREEALRRLVEMGYEREDQVEGRGHFALRGDILDIYTTNMDEPIRIEFFGDEIDTIRTFSLTTQRSTEQLDSCSILPVHIKAEQKASLLSYVGDGLLIIDEHQRVQEGLKGYLHEKKEHEESHFNWRHWMESIAAKSCVFFNFLQKNVPYVTIQEHIGLSAKGMTSFERQMPILMDEIKHWKQNKEAILLVMQNRQRKEGVLQAMDRDGISYTLAGEEDELTLQPGTVTVTEGLLTDGFEMLYSHLVVVTEANIYGAQKEKLRRNRHAKGEEIKYFTDLVPGDYVVHDVQGIGKYVGVKTIETSGITRDYIEIEYAGTDKLYLPTDKLMSLQKYIGNEGETPKLHAMGGVEWRRVRTKAKKSIEDLAEKLVALYAKREIVEGFAFEPDDPWQREFEDAFPYEETPDQLQATAEIKASMEKPKPMDRLLCGDVGFGKTEVAMRAAFKAVMSGKQVAVLVPTTILAQQHFQTFLQRFSPFEVRVEVLNRFRTMAEKKQIIERLEKGSIDILIGTHALLSKTVKFRDLGLLIVDEEQRFGVAQKEKWKQWANNIDVLTLSATPIPRTLHMSLVGVREMSVINTPPEERLPVQTYVAEFDLNLVKEAIRRELSRGGQVFIVYNKVQSIYNIGHQLEAVMPDLRYAIAHGQMTGAQMEAVMVDFYEGKYDVLLSTSIVENGIDVPNANTIIVYDADHMGLSQLYQMRGRVGRSSKRAYAYFLYRKDKVLTEMAEKRLQAMKDFTELGAGFKVAMRDLEIRGAGSLLGSQQHGNIAAIGFAMYCTMLEHAIAKAQNKEVEKDTSFEVSIHLNVNAYIDEKYIKDSGQKISMYQKLLRARTKEAVDEFVDELVDRFGTPTDYVDNLVSVAYIKARARELGIQTVTEKGDGIDFIWADDSKMANWDMASVRQDLWKRMVFSKNKPTTLHVKMTAKEKENILSFTKSILTELERR